MLMLLPLTSAPRRRSLLPAPTPRRALHHKRPRPAAAARVQNGQESPHCPPPRACWAHQRTRGSPGLEHCALPQRPPSPPRTRPPVGSTGRRCLCFGELSGPSPLGSAGKAACWHRLCHRASEESSGGRRCRMHMNRLPLPVAPTRQAPAQRPAGAPWPPPRRRLRPRPQAPAPAGTRRPPAGRTICATVAAPDRPAHAPFRCIARQATRRRPAARQEQPPPPPRTDAASTPADIAQLVFYFTEK